VRCSVGDRLSRLRAADLGIGSWGESAYNTFRGESCVDRHPLAKHAIDALIETATQFNAGA
jgi:hypothetical protein